MIDMNQLKSDAEAASAATVAVLYKMQSSGLPASGEVTPEHLKLVPPFRSELMGIIKMADNAGVKLAQALEHCTSEEAGDLVTTAKKLGDTMDIIYLMLTRLNKLEKIYRIRDEVNANL